MSGGSEKAAMRFVLTADELRAMVSRIIKDLSTGSYISIHRDRILVNRQPPLRW